MLLATLLCCCALLAISSSSFVIFRSPSIYTRSHHPDSRTVVVKPYVSYNIHTVPMPLGESETFAYTFKKNIKIQM